MCLWQISCYVLDDIVILFVGSITLTFFCGITLFHIIIVVGLIFRNVVIVDVIYVIVVVGFKTGILASRRIKSCPMSNDLWAYPLSCSQASQLYHSEFLRVGVSRVGWRE